MLLLCCCGVSKPAPILLLCVLLLCAAGLWFAVCLVISVIYFGMTITRAENCGLPQRSTELIASAENTSDSSTWPFYVGVQSVRSRIETEAELDS